MQKLPLTISELTEQIKDYFELEFERVYLQGEVSNLAFPRSGHVYFNLKDPFAQISAVMFKSTAQRIKFDLESGLEVLAKGRITVYKPRGQYQLIIDSIEPLGTGALQLAFEQLKQKLHLEGLFDAEHKQALPVLPCGIGIVTSPTGAAIRDILNVLKRRFPNIPVLINPVAVQGENASREIAKAIRQLQKEAIDLIIVARGGGSIEDLWAFNEEVVAKAIFKSKIPIISAVGHETDFTISDFVADLRAPTPSAAAELAVPLKSDLEELVQNYRDRLQYLMVQGIRGYQERLKFFKKRLRSPEWVIQSHTMKVDDLSTRLERIVKSQISEQRSFLGMIDQRLQFKSPNNLIVLIKNQVNDLLKRLEFNTKTLLEKKKTKFNELSHVLNSLSPLSILDRGYSVAMDESQQTISSVKQVELDSTIFIKLSDGTIKSKTEKIIPKINSQ
ncbi:MAG: exodeoxyribonuclease VII large subunit [Deltaproteobacteria bacterium]|jgi:exodeoxyribonuclease VII large subunit|nr:exodeoxyribonuclease VII large subunit [Deltaproteobacteria bacterium]MBT4527035.1 exodeoxyribonuclease VII large subunit [Deltaproteobacteria bacterium]